MTSRSSTSPSAWSPGWVEGDEGEGAATGEFHRITVSGPIRLAEGRHLSVPFQLERPWETPITAVYGVPLHGMVMGVRTEVSIARAVDKGHLDPIHVNPLPVQQRILDGFAQLGFGFEGAPTWSTGRSPACRRPCPSTRRSNTSPHPTTRIRSTRSS